MKFKFPLQKVMQHRKVLEDLAQRDFQEAHSELLKHQEILNGLLEAVTNARNTAFHHQSEGGKASPVLVQVHDFLKGQDIRIERQKERVKECESRVENLREILRQQAIDYKIIEELKDRQLVDFKIDQRKLEQKRSDDLNLMRFRREDTKK
jgi:flagellar FliJ protein